MAGGQSAWAGYREAPSAFQPPLRALLWLYGAHRPAHLVLVLRSVGQCGRAMPAGAAPSRVGHQGPSRCEDSFFQGVLCKGRL
jgi:hypothetical protein